MCSIIIANIIHVIGYRQADNFLSVLVMQENLKHLNWLAEKFSDFNVMRCVITAGPYAFTRNDGIHIIPAALLGA